MNPLHEMANEDQTQEIEVLQSIYTKEELRVLGMHYKVKVFVWVHVHVPNNYTIKFIANQNKEVFSCIKVQHLPPIQMEISFPSDYPHSKKPCLILHCEWLTNEQIQHLRKRLKKIWKKNQYTPIVYTWIEFLKSEALEELKIEKQIEIFSEEFLNYDNYGKLLNKAKSLEVSKSCENIEEFSAEEIFKVNDKLHHLIESFENFDQDRHDELFKKTYHECKICLANERGLNCMFIEQCKHIFCRQCLYNYLITLIDNGNFFVIKCPEYECDKGLYQFQIKEILPPAKFEKYDSFLLNSAIDSMSDIEYCPKLYCQYPVTKSNFESIAQCPACGFWYCLLCKKATHGIQKCRKKKINSEDMMEKLEFKLFAQKKLTEFWLEDNTKQCPKCMSIIQKIAGCNKVICTRCETMFCWLCSTRLNPKDPYEHFGNPRSKCNNKMFLIGQKEKKINNSKYRKMGFESYLKEFKDLELN